MKTAVRVESYGDTLGAPAGLERGAFPVKTGGERYKTPGQYRSDLKGQTADGSVGHWERDLMVGKNHKSAVLVVTDRKSRFNKLRKLNGKHAKKVTRETAKALKGLPIKTMSNDRGQEFSDHQNYEKKSKVKVYFCDPYSSYQRGTNENRIGAIRQYLPKKTDLTNLTNKDLEKIEFQINNRPMKCLDWMTPVEFMMEKSCTGKL
jgi:IS30 family transposase